jgi:hypothetical protein
MIKWIVGLILMGLYQYWVYDRFWISENDVSRVKQARHVSGNIVSIDCAYITKSDGRYSIKLFVELLNHPKFYFYDESSHESCEDVYTTFHRLLPKANGSKKLVTKINNNFYQLATLEGYFFGSSPLDLKINSYKWFEFDKTRKTWRGVALWLSATGFFTVFGYVLRDWYKKGLIHKVVDYLGRN